MQLYIPDKEDTLYLSHDWKFLLKSRPGNKRLLGALVGKERVYVERIQRLYHVEMSDRPGEYRSVFSYTERPDLGTPRQVNDFSYWTRQTKDSFITLPKNTALKVETIEPPDQQDASIRFRVISSTRPNVTGRKFWVTLKEVRGMHFEFAPQDPEDSSIPKKLMASIRAKR